MEYPDLHLVTATNTSGVHIALDKRSDLDVSNIWVKFGLNVTMGEARTQRFVAQYLPDNNNPAVRAPRVYLAFTWGGLGYTVTEYTDGQICDNSSPPLQALITIPSPSSTPGPIGGGLIEHPFLVDRISSIWYETVEELQDHVNWFLSVTERRGCINLRNKLANRGQLLCVSDLKPVNFMRDKDDTRIVAVDFGGYSFLPPSFSAFALKHGDCAHRIATML